MDLKTAHIRVLSARLRRFVTGLATALWLLLLLERFGAIGLRALDHGIDAAAVRAFVVQLIAALPEAMYLLALDATRRALASIEQGHFYAPTITRMLDRMGLLLAAGAFIGVFLAPTLQRAVGAGPGYWIAFDISTLVLGTLGLSLTVIARVIGHAALLKAELDEMF